MNGILTSKAFLSVLVVAFTCLPGRADFVDLGNEARVSGRVAAIDAQGRVTVASELSDEPLIVRPEAVESIQFDPAIDDKLTVPDQEIQLVNGDALPCRIKSMDDEKIRISTWFAGDLAIPRKYVSALHFGISKPKPILGGKKALAGWSKSDAWEIDSERLMMTSTRTGRVVHRLEKPLPEQFIIRFHYRWKRIPNFRFHFAINDLDDSQSDRYILTINVAGVEVKRQSKTGRTYTTLSLNPQRPSTAWPDGMDIELRVDRSLSEPLFLLFINGDLLDRFSDAVKNPPSGPGLMFESSSGGGSANIIEDFEILDWNGDSSDRRKRADAPSDKDAVYDRQGEHFSGQALSIANRGGETVIVFRHPHAKEPLRIPLDRASALWFRKPEKPVEIPATPLVLGLVDNGLLHLDSCVLDDRRAKCTHPLLGKLTIKRRAVSTIRHGKKSGDS